MKSSRLAVNLNIIPSDESRIFGFYVNDSGSMLVWSLRTQKMRSSLVFGDTTEGHHSSFGMNFQWKLQFKNGFGDAPPAVMQIVDLHAATRIADEALIFHYLKVHQFFFIFVMQNHRPSPLLLIATIARQLRSNFSLNFFFLSSHNKKLNFN